MNIGIDHGYYAIKTRLFSFPAGISQYSHEPYTLQNTLEFGGKFFVCGTGRQPILRNKMENDNYYLLTLAAVAKEIKQRGGTTECSVKLAAGLPLAGFGREKKPFREYLLRSSQPVCFKFEGIPYKITIEDVKLFPQGYSAIAIHPELIQNEPSVLLMDIGGWTVDLMRLDNGVPNASTCRILELGMIRCIDETKEQVRRDTGLSVTDAQVERVLAGKPCSMDENARNIIQKQGRLYAERLLSAAMESGFDLKAIPVVMLGGGAAVVKGSVTEQDGLCRVFALIDDKVKTPKDLNAFWGICRAVWARHEQAPLCSAPTSRMKNIAEHGKSCRLCRKDRKAPFWYGQFWQPNGRKNGKPPCAGCCGRNSKLFLPSQWSSRRKPSRRRYHDVYEEIKPKVVDKDSIMNDVVFEMELVKH